MVEERGEEEEEQEEEGTDWRCSGLLGVDRDIGVLPRRRRRGTVKRRNPAIRLNRRTLLINGAFFRIRFFFFSLYVFGWHCWEIPPGASAAWFYMAFLAGDIIIRKLEE